MIKLPTPKFKSNVSIEEAILKRRSIRNYNNKDLSIEQISQLLWAAQGITDTKKKRGRAAPSAGALYPLELYLLSSQGIFHYIPEQHAIEKISNKDIRKDLVEVSLNQDFIANAGVIIILSAVYSRITDHYGTRGIRYVDMEAGHTAQNIHLQAVSLGLGSVPIGAFSEEGVQRLLNLANYEKPIYLIPVGFIKE